MKTSSDDLKNKRKVKIFLYFPEQCTHDSYITYFRTPDRNQYTIFTYPSSFSTVKLIISYTVQ